ncbi:flagellin [Fibrobacteria bacterium R8-3-H12]
MQINHNIRAMVTQHSLYSNNNSMTKSLEKLSTGLRINRAQDDSAGLAMSEQMRTQIRGLGKAKQNSQDSIGALQIAEGGLAEITNILQRQRELAVQSANDTLTSTERKYLNDEFQELSNEVARISRTTDYNGKNMLNWSDDPNKSFGAIGDTQKLKDAVGEEYKKLNDELVGKIKDDDLKGYATTGIAALNTFISAINSATDGVDISSDLKDFETAAIALKKQADEATVNGKYSAQDKDVLNTIADRLYKISTMRSDTIMTDKGFSVQGTGVNSSAIASLGELVTAAIKAGDMAGKAASYTLHIGANYSVGFGGKWGNEMTVTYISLNPGSLGLAHRDIKTQNNSTDAIDQLDKVIKSVSAARAKIGTFINRLEYTINNIANLEFNTQDAESRIRDTDFATETTNFTRNQIMVQASTSMLAQANSLPQAVLGLIG